MTEIKTNDEFTDIQADVYENGKRVTTLDEKTEKKLFEVELAEEVDANLKPKVLAIDGYNNGLMTCKIVTSQTDTVIGVVAGGRNLINTKYNLIKQGIVTDPTLTGGILNQEVYCNQSGELSLTFDFFRIGRLVQVSPPVVYINIGEEKSQDLTFSQGFNNLENPSQNLETALRKIAFFSHKNFRTIETGLSGLVDITYGNGLFVAISNNGLQNSIVTSPDGITWTIRSLPVTITYPTFSKIAFGNGIFLAICSAGNKFAYSNDGITWTYTSVSGSNYDLVYAIPYTANPFEANGFYVQSPSGSPPNSSLYYPYDTMSPAPKANTGFLDIVKGGPSAFEGPFASGMATMASDLTSYTTYVLANVAGLTSIANISNKGYPSGPVAVIAGPAGGGKIVHWDYINPYSSNAAWINTGVPAYGYYKVKYFVEFGLLVAFGSKVLTSSDGFIWEERKGAFPTLVNITIDSNGLLAAVNNSSKVYIGCLI